MGCGDLEVDVLVGETMEGVSVLKEYEEGLIVVSGRGRQGEYCKEAFILARHVVSDIS